MAQNNVEMVNLLVMNGADVIDANTYEFPSTTLKEMLQKREVGHQINVPANAPDEVLSARFDAEKRGSLRKYNKVDCLRVSIYRGHPVERRQTFCKEPGRLIRLPNSFEELKRIAGTYFSMDIINHF